MTKKNITQQSKQLQQDWETNPRWKNAKRTYSAEDVIRLRGSITLKYVIIRDEAPKNKKEEPKNAVLFVLNLKGLLFMAEKIIKGIAL